MPTKHDIPENAHQNLFQYHDNVVRVPMFSSGDYKLVEGTFTVKELSISPGQDPQNKNRVGDVKTWRGSNRSMTFVVGRHGTSDVASWWTRRISSSQNTFNHNPGALNFAFLGTIVLKITGGIFGTSTGVYTLEDVGIAQGHTGLANNWWFGGVDGLFMGHNVIRISGKRSSGEEAYFFFHRGGKTIDNDNVIDLVIFDPQ